MTLKIERFPHVYEPAMDTFFLIEYARPAPDDFVLELCTGCGLIALHMAQTAAFVHATDINPHAVANAQHNAKINGIENVRIHHGDLYAPVKNHQFDLIVANPPYVPTPPDWQATDIIETAWNAGTDGRLLIDRIIAGLCSHLKPSGQLVLVQSSLSNIPKTGNRLQDLGFQSRIVAKKWLPFGPVSQGRLTWLKQRGYAPASSRAELLAVIHATRGKMTGA